MPRGPVQAWEHQLLAQGGRGGGGGLPCARRATGMGQEATAVPFSLQPKQTRALTCAHLCSCPQRRCSGVFSCSGLALRLSPADSVQPPRDQAGAGPATHGELLQGQNWQGTSFFSQQCHSPAGLVNSPAQPWRDERRYEDVRGVGISQP